MGRILGANNAAEIEKAKLMQKIEEQPPNPDPTEGLSEAEIEAKIKELSE